MQVLVTVLDALAWLSRSNFGLGISCSREPKYTVLSLYQIREGHFMNTPLKPPSSEQGDVPGWPVIVIGI